MSGERGARPPTSLLQPYGGQVSADATEAARHLFQPNPLFLAAQLAALLQGVLAVIVGVNIIRGTTSIRQVAMGVNVTPSAVIATRYGVGVVIIGVLVFIAGVHVGQPSQLTRALLTLWELIALGLTLAAWFGGGSVFGFATVLVSAAGGSSILPVGAAMGLEAGLVYALAMHPPTYRAFAT